MLVRVQEFNVVVNVGWVRMRRIDVVVQIVGRMRVRGDEVVDASS